MYSSARHRVESHGIISMVRTPFKAFSWCRSRHCVSNCKWRSKMANPLKSFLASNGGKDSLMQQRCVSSFVFGVCGEIGGYLPHSNPNRCQLLGHRASFVCFEEKVLQELRGRFSFLEVFVKLHIRSGVTDDPTQTAHTTTRSTLSIPCEYAVCFHLYTYRCIYPKKWSTKHQYGRYEDKSMSHTNTNYWYAIADPWQFLMSRREPDLSEIISTSHSYSDNQKRHKTVKVKPDRNGSQSGYCNSKVDTSDTFKSRNRGSQSGYCNFKVDTSDTFKSRNRGTKSTNQPNKPPSSHRPLFRCVFFLFFPH